MKKILLVNTVYGRGSVGRIIGDLYRCGENAGYETYAAFSRSDVPEGIRGVRIGNVGDLAGHVAMDILADRGGFGSAAVTRKFLQWVDTVQPDLIHLHNIHGFYLQVEVLFRYLRERGIPVVWTLHDCWPITGHCAYFEAAGCAKWKAGTGCHNCPQHLQAYPYSVWDYSRKGYERKRAAFTGVLKLTIVTPSVWLKNIVGESFLKEYPVEVIPNGIDLSIFKPYRGDAADEIAAACGVTGNPSEACAEKSDSYNNLRMKSENTQPGDGEAQTVLQSILAQKGGRRLILGVANVWTKRKGYEMLLHLAKKLSDDEVLCLVGVSKRQQRKLESEYRGKVLPVTHTDSVEELAGLYNAADVFVNPTFEDNFPTTNLEALACGTPVVTASVGGSTEMLTSGGCVLTDVGDSFAPGDEEGMERVVQRVLDRGKAAYTQRCAAQGRLYGRQKSYERYLALYARVLGDTVPADRLHPGCV